MLTIWDFLAFALIALSVVAAITHAIGEAGKKFMPSGDVTLDAMMARVAATGWHFATERDDRYRIWHANNLGGVKREILTNSADNDVAIWLRALGCLDRGETFAKCRPRYVERFYSPATPVEQLVRLAERAHHYGLRDSHDMLSIVRGVFGRPEVDHPAFHALLSLVRTYVSGRVVSEAELAEALASLNPEELKANAAAAQSARAERAALEAEDAA